VYQTRYRQLFHSDCCDIAGLLCLRPAMSGGESAIASSNSVYNEMARRRPDLARVLAQPFVVDRKNEFPDGKGPTYDIPIFHHAEEHLTTIYARDFIRGRPAAARGATAQRRADRGDASARVPRRRR